MNRYQKSVTVCVFLVSANATHMEAYAQVATKACELGSPVVSKIDSKIRITVDLKCDRREETSSPFQVGKSYLLGATLYAVDASGETNPEAEALQSLGQQLKNQKKTSFTFDHEGTNYQIRQHITSEHTRNRLIVQDDPFEGTRFSEKPYDLKIQQRTMTAASSVQTVVFESENNIPDAYNYFLIAVWPISAKHKCASLGDETRHGCKKFGIVIGDNASVQPMLFYPGIATLTNGPSESSAWIVENF